MSAILVAGPAAGGRAHGQAADSVEIMPGAHYRAAGLERTLLGDNWRKLWTTPVRVPVLDLSTFAGGLEPIEAGGGRMTRTLHLQGADGRRYIFRSLDKYVEQALPPDLQRTLAHDVFQDHMSALLPTGALMVPPLLAASGVLHVTPVLYVMPADPRLGEHGEVFAGMAGAIEVRADEGADGAPGFAGSSRVVGTDRLVERLDEDPAQRVEEREYLAARLVDFLIGDTDRGSDQWRWAGMETAGGGLRFRPVPRDRDFAFFRSDGRLSAVARRLFPKLVRFGPELPSTRALTFSSIHRDRQFLSGLSRTEWDSVTLAVQRALTDAVLDSAIAALPPAHRAMAERELRVALRARRDALHGASARFYEYVAREVDIRATSEADTALVQVLDDGRVRVLVSGRSAAQPRFERVFDPRDTREVRLYLLDGNDRVVVQGGGRTAITLHVVGGGGDDELTDATSPGPTRVHFHDAEGSNTVTGHRGTRIDRRAFVLPESDTGWAARRVARARFRDWGGGTSIRPRVDIEEGAGLVLGTQVALTRRGFRRVPHAYRLWVAADYATGSGGFAVGLGADRTWTNSPWSASVSVTGSQFDSFRFAGLGNDAPAPPRLPGSSHGRVRQDAVAVEPAVHFARGATELSLGLRARYLDPRPAPGTVLATQAPYGATAFGTAGPWADAVLHGRRHTLRGGAWLVPGVWDAPGVSAGVTADAGAEVPLPRGPALALRAGGRRAWGEFAIQDAAYIGGRSTLRGYRHQRFAGDAAAFGGAELRAPVARTRILVRGTLGVFAFADAGRVYVNGASPGGWHTGHGAGLSFTSLGMTARASWARGEGDRVYLEFGSR